MIDKTKIAVAVFDKLATVYQNKFMDVNLYADTFDFFCNRITKENAAILDIACGPGNITRYLLNKRPDFKILGLDLAPKMVQLARINNPNAEFKVMDCRDIGAINQKYEAVMCGFCLPYLSREETNKLIRDVSNLLKPEGILYLSTMEDDYDKSGFRTGSTGDKIFMHYYQADDLTGVLEENHFNILKTERISYLESGREYLTTDLIIIAEKQL